MANVVRTKADILTKFPDNTGMTITPQDLRDFVVSIFGVYGQIYSSEASIAVAITNAPWEKLAGGFSTDGEANDVTASQSDSKLTINTTGIYFISFNISISGITAGAKYQFRVAKNGSLLAVSGQSDSVDETSLHIAASGIFSLTNADDIELWVKHNVGSTENVTVSDASLLVRRIG